MKLLVLGVALMRVKIGLITAVAGILGNYGVHGSAIAASFDCTHAASPQEKLICGDPILFELDERLGRTYQERREALSPQGAELLHSSQRSWLRYVATVCAAAVPNDDRRDNPKDCLQSRYKERLKQLGDVGQRLGAFVFNRIDIFFAQAVPSDIWPGPYDNFYYVRHVAYPQIDYPSSAQAQAWNKQAMRDLSRNDDCADGDDDDTDYELYANERVISLRWDVSYYCHGAANGSDHFEIQNDVIAPTFRALTAEDVFGVSQDWVENLRQLFRQKFDNSAWASPPGERTESIWDTIQDMIIQPQNWQFTAEGLKVSFSPDDFFCRLCAPAPVTVPWSEMKPLLSKEALVP
jgi:uncharacterized protein